MALPGMGMPPVGAEGAPGVPAPVLPGEGWPAGVYLAALCLRGHPSPSAFVRQFTGDNRFVVDFLAEEVLSRQPGEVRRFLNRRSVLPRFCARLCDAVAGRSVSAAIMSSNTSRPSRRHCQRRSWNR